MSRLRKSVSVFEGREGNAWVHADPDRRESPRRRGRLLFTQLYDEVGYAAIWRVIWEPLPQSHDCQSDAVEVNIQTKQCIPGALRFNSVQGTPAGQFTEDEQSVGAEGQDFQRHLILGGKPIEDDPSRCFDPGAVFLHCAPRSSTPDKPDRGGTQTALRACIKKTLERELFSADVTAGDPKVPIDRGKYILHHPAPIWNPCATQQDSRGKHASIVACAAEWHADL